MFGGTVHLTPADCYSYNNSMKYHMWMHYNLWYYMRCNKNDIKRKITSVPFQLLSLEIHTRTIHLQIGFNFMGSTEQLWSFEKQMYSDKRNRHNLWFAGSVFFADTNGPNNRRPPFKMAVPTETVLQTVKHRLTEYRFGPAIHLIRFCLCEYCILVTSKRMLCGCAILKGLVKTGPF